MVPVPVQVALPALLIVPPSDLAAAPLMLSGTVPGRVQLPTRVPPVQLTVPAPEKVLVPATTPESISKVTAPASVLVTLLKVTVAPLTRLVPGPVSVRLPLKEKTPA